MTDFNERQNKNFSIDKLAAQKQLYSDAKKGLATYLVLSIPVILFLNLIVKAALLKDWFSFGWTPDLTEWIALYALILAGYESFYLKGFLSNLKEKAAKIQEDFDCYVYQLSWNELLCGEKECDSEIKKSSDKYRKKVRSTENLSNWYTSDIKKLEQTEAILVCQKENLGWDIVQRTKFNKLIFGISIIVLLCSLLSGFYFEFSFKFFILSVIIPSWPAMSFAISYYYENLETIKDKKRLKTATNQVEHIQVPTNEYARQVQDLIYLNRKNNCLIFDWFYNLLRDENQGLITYTTKKIINRLL